MRMHLPFRARFKESVDEILGLDVPLPALLAKHAALVSQPAGGVLPPTGLPARLSAHKKSPGLDIESGGVNGLEF